MKHLKKFNEDTEPWNLRKTPGEEDVHWTDDTSNRGYPRMKQWCVTTTSESSDHYIYFIEHPTKPTKEELEKFLLEKGNDTDGEQSYESVDMCVQIEYFERL